MRFLSLESDGEPAGGTWQACGIALDGTAYCWGANFFGQLGIGNHGDRSQPTPVAGNLQFAQVSVGRYHTCALTPDGDAYCWGANNFEANTGVNFDNLGDLGVGDTLDRAMPTAVVGGLKFRQIEAGWGITCAITLQGEGYCWGRNSLGAVGNAGNFGASDDYKAEPTKVASAELFQKIATTGT